MAKLKLGYKASAEQFGPRDLVEFAVHAEACGFDSVWISDHFQPWRHTGGHAPFSLACLAAMGERTRRVQHYSRMAGKLIKLTGPAVPRRDQDLQGVPRRIGWIHEYHADHAVRPTG